MPPSRFVRLTEQEDIQLPEIEQDHLLKPKVRLRAQVLRLSHRGYQHALHRLIHRSQPAESIGRDLDRWEALVALRALPTGRLRATLHASPRR